MSYESRAYDNEHGNPVVVLVATGTHDVSRLVNLLQSGNCEQVDLGATVLRQVRRHNGGRAALQLLAAHGGPDFLHDDEPAAKLAAAVAWAAEEYERCIVAARVTTDSHQYATCNGRAEAYRQLCVLVAEAAGIAAPDWEAIKKAVPTDGIYRPEGGEPQ